MRSFSRYLVCLIAVLGCSTIAWAQQSSITGSVRDTTGAAIPGATVTLTNIQQGFTRTMKSNASGDYLFAGLPAGNYNVAVTARGFTKYQIRDLVLRVSEKARADANLQLGQVSTEITVAGTNVSQVQTQSGSLSGVLTTRQIHQLVLNNRNFTQLITLIPGVSNQTGQDEGAVGVNGNVGYSVNGGRTEYNNWEIDGSNDMDNGSNSTLNVYPNVDAVQEVRVLTSNYGAQNGRNASGTVQVITKSGTQQFHGDVFEFVRNDAFNARNFFQSTVPEYRKNDFGYTIGGPVFIPKLYNANRQKTFFFFSEEWRKSVTPGQTFNNHVPSNEERGGNFSDVCPSPGAAVDTDAFPNCPVNPLTSAYFPNNQVPVAPQAQTLLPLIPAPTTGSGASSFFNAAPAQPTNWREELARVDQNFTDKEHFFFRFIHDSWSTVEPTPLWGTGDFPTVGTNFVGPGVNLVANLTSTISPTLLNEFSFGYTTDHIFLDAIGPVQRPSDFNMPGIFANGFRGLLPNVTIENTGEYDGGFAAGTGYFPWNNANPTYTYKDKVSMILGKHNLFIGVYFVAGQKNEDNSPDAQGSLTFNGSASQISTGNGFADFLIGRIAAFDQTTLLTKYYNRYKIFAPYIQDDWHVSKRLTLNLGLRISMMGTYYAKYKREYSWEPNAYDASQITLNPDDTVSGNQFTGLVQCGASGVPRGCMEGHLFNPAPRFGFAYDVFGNGKTAIRGGYGIFYDHTNGNEANTESLEGSAPLVQNSTVYNVPNYTSISVTGVAPPGPLNVTSIPTRVTWPYVQQWNFAVEQEIPSHTVVSVAYAGSKGTHLTDQRGYNQLYPVPASQNPYLPGQVISSNDCSSMSVNGSPVTGQVYNNLNVACGNVSPDLYRPYQGFGTITQLELEANSSYNALQVSAHRYVGPLNFSLAYTWSHSIDDSSDRYDGGFVNSYDLEGSRASSNFDQRQILNISYVYNLPLFTKQGILHTLLGGWQLSGLIAFQTGTPFGVTNGAYGDNAGVGNGVGTGSYVDIIGNANAAPPVTNVAGVIGPLLYNPAAFAEPTGLTFGNSGRNILNNPARTNWDMGLFKNFHLTETRMFEFRAEAFNVFNHTQWNGIDSGASCYAGPNNSPGDPSCIAGSTFLHPTGAHDPRILQLGLKFIF
ncbi:MAG TPA: TonB-dependent receptor [Bryobacteraceae bacterium]